MRHMIGPCLAVLATAVVGCGGDAAEENATGAENVADATRASDERTKDAETDTAVPEEKLCNRTAGACSPALSPGEYAGQGFRFTGLAIGKDGTAGQGLNIDPEAGMEDCQPAGKCEEGIDNALSVLGGFANDGLASALDNGKLMIVGGVNGELEGTFSIHLFAGVPADGDCAFQDSLCTYHPTPASWDCDCTLRASMTGSIQDGILTAGGDEGIFNFTFPIDEETLEISAVRAQLTGTVVATEDGLELTQVVIGGAARQDTLIETIENHPAETFGPVNKSTLVTIISGILPDVDTDGDGVDDALSVGLTATAIPGVIGPLASEPQTF